MPGPALHHVDMTAGRRPGAREVAAARENAEWVDLFCRSHGITGQLGNRVWRSPRRTPPFYPDAVTISPEATESDAVSGIDRTAGASVKDSFAALDLTPCGFSRLFDARWLWRDGDARAPRATPATARVAWETVTTPGGLAAWESAWAGGAPPTGFFAPSLLDSGQVRFLAGYDGDALVAGVLLHLAKRVVGVSNLFVRELPSTDVWLWCLPSVSEAAAGRPLVGYLPEKAAGAALRSGFEVLGPLTVWVLGDDA